MRSRHDQRGYLLVTVVVTLFLVASIAVLLTHESSVSANTANRELETARGDYVTRAGMQHALWRAQNDRCMGDVTIPATSLGGDSYTATISGASAGTLHLLAVDQDAWIQSDDESRNNGATSSNGIRLETDGTEQILTRFDISSIAANARIHSAVAWFHLKSGTDHLEGGVTIHEITANWNETDVTWAAFDGAYRNSVIGTIPPQETGDVWVAVNLTAQVQAWVNGQPNFGILFDAKADGTNAEYTAREDSVNPPRLEVVVGSGPASTVAIEATGTLADGVSRTLNRPLATTYQTPVIHTFSPGPVESEDAEIWDQQPNDNFGDSSETWVSSASNDTTRTLLRFDMAAIPSGAKILEATLSLYHQSGSGTDQPVSAHRILSPWSEDTVTWNSRESGTSWTTPGGDFDSTAIATTPVGPANERYEWSITPLAQGWVDGSFPNYGVAMTAAVNGMDGERFYTSDQGILGRRPGLRVRYVCACGNACMAPRGSGNLLLVRNRNNPTQIDTEYQARFESWGYTVQLIDDWATQDDFNAAMASNDAVFVSGASPFAVGNKLTNAPIGVVNARGEMNDQLGIASGYASPVGSQIDITDTSHFITAVFPTGPLDIYEASMSGLTLSGGAPAGTVDLADWGGNGAMVVLDQGAPLSSGGTAAARRVLLPVSASSDIDWRYVTNDGALLTQRAIAWAMKDDIVIVGDLLMVVGNDGNLTDQESAKKSLLESWGYTVSVIDEDDNQDAFDAALADNDVVFVTEDAQSSDVGSKLNAAEIGVVIEEVNLASQLGLGASIVWSSGTELVIDSGHYITAALTPGTTEVLNTTESLATLGGALSTEIDTLGTLGADVAISALDAARYRHDGGGTAGRRVMLPWGGNNMDVSYLTDDGLTIFRRAIEWAAGACLDTTPLLFVVGDTANLNARESELGGLLSDWCYSVTLIDDGADQAEFDTASSMSKVIYVSYSVDDATLADKLTMSTIGIVNEGLYTQDTFGFGDNPTNTLYDQFTGTNATHYISKPFEGVGVTLFAAQYAMPGTTGTIAPDIESAAEIGAWTWPLPTLESGAQRWDGLLSAGRRVHHGFGTAPISDLTADARTMLKRTVEWAATPVAPETSHKRTPVAWV